MSISRGLLGEPKVRGLGLGLAAAFALCDAACWAGVGKLAWKGVNQKFASFEGFWEGQKVRGLGLGWLPPSCPEVKGVGWAVAAAFAFADAAAGPCWSRGGLVNHFKSEKPKGLGLGLAAAFGVGDAASCWGSGSLA